MDFKFYSIYLWTQRNILDESKIKAHGLTDTLLFISKKLETGCTLEEIRSELLHYIEKTIKTLFDIDFATTRVERILNNYDQLNIS